MVRIEQPGWLEPTEQPMDLSHTPRPKPDDNSEQVNLDAEEKILRKAALAAGGPDPKAPEKEKD